MTIKYGCIFSIKFLKYLYYGLKQRCLALLKQEIGIFAFFKSLFKCPVEAWIFSKLELKYGY